MRNYFIVISMLFIACTTYAQSTYKDMIILKDTTSLYCNISRVEKNALVIESDEGTGIMLKTVAIIHTGNKMVMEELSQKIKGIKVISENGKYIINFEDADIPAIVPQKENFMKYESIAFGYSPNDFSTAGINLTAEFPSLNFVIASFECSVGTKADEKIFHNFNFGFGGGIKYESGIASTLVQLRYRNSGAIEYPHGSKGFLAFELSERVQPAINIPVYIFISYSRNIPDDERFQDIFYVGFGVKL